MKDLKKYLDTDDEEEFKDFCADNNLRYKKDGCETQSLLVAKA